MDRIFIGRHILVDVITNSPLNLTSVDKIYNLMENLSIELKMTLIHPPVVAKIPFATSELSRYTNQLIKENVDTPSVQEMKQSLEQQKNNQSGISAIAMWLESHTSIHTWPEKNFFSFDAYSCKEFNSDTLFNVLIETFDISEIRGCNIVRYQQSNPEVVPVEIFL